MTTHLLPPGSLDAYVGMLAEHHGPSPFSWPAMTEAERATDLAAWALDGEEANACPAARRHWRPVFVAGLHREMLRALVEECVGKLSTWADHVLEGEERAPWIQAREEALALLALDWHEPKTDSIGMLALLRSWGELSAAAANAAA